MEAEERNGVVIFKHDGAAFAEYSKAERSWSLLPHSTGAALLAWQAERDALRAHFEQLEAVKAERDEALAHIATLEAERVGLQVQIVCCNHEFAAIAKALGLGRSTTAGDVADAVAEMLARIAALEAERRWIPASERLPETPAPVLARFQRGSGTCLVWCFEVCVYSRFFGWCGTGGTVTDVSDWRPIEHGGE